MAGQLLDISKHNNLVRSSQPVTSAGRRARVYRFPAGEALVDPLERKHHVHSQLTAQIGIGLMVWLIWFVWHLTH